MPELEPIPPGFFESAAAVFTTMVEVPATRSEIWSALVDNAGWESWFSNCRGCEGTPPVWTAAGNTRTIRVGPIRVDEIAIELVPEERWAMALTATNLPIARRMAESIDLVDTSREGETRTELHWTGALDPLWHVKPVVDLVGNRLVEGWGQSFEDLNDHLSGHHREA